MVRIIVVKVSTICDDVCDTNLEKAKRVECTFKRSFIIEYAIDSFLTENNISV